MAQQIAPAISKHGRNYVLENFAFFFGDPAEPEKLRDYSEHHAQTYHFPDAYKGSSTKIRDTLNSLILKQPSEWQTAVGLPFVKIEGTTVEWDEMHFDMRLLQRVPYEGISRMQTSLRRRHRDRVVRRGIGMMIESDFFATEAGREYFKDQLTSIRYCVQETCNFDAIFAYLTCTNYDFRYDMNKGLRPRRSVRNAMAHEIMLYGIVQMEGNGLDRAVEEVKQRMGRYNVKPNMLICPPQLLLYLATAPEEKIKYIEGGNLAVTRFEEGVEGYETRNFRGLGVFQSTPYDVSEESDSVQMLQRNSQVGEFYRMTPPAVWDGSKKLPSAYMDIMIYDEEADQLKHITFKQAFYAAIGGSKFKDILTLIDWKNACKLPSFLAADTEGVRGADGSPVKTAYDLLKAPAGAGDDALDEALEKILPEHFVTCVEGGVWVPICITLARPFIEHLMMSCIVTVSGRDTGATLFGPADMQVSANTSVKTIEGHYTCHTKCVITKPQNVYVMRDVLCNGYVGGSNARFFCNPKQEQLDENSFGAADKVQREQGRQRFRQEVNRALTQRLQYEEDDDGAWGSLLAFVSSYKESQVESRDQVISLSLRVLPWETGGGATADKKHFPGGKDGYDHYKDIYQLESVHFGEDKRAAENQSFMSQGSTNNAICFIGPHRRYNPFASNFFELIPGQGHFGTDAIPGDCRWRRGESVSLKAARDSMVSLEVAAHSQLVFNTRGNIA